MDSKVCPKCHTRWPKSCKYCICGAKLPDVKEFLEGVFGDVDGLKEVFTGDTDGH